MTRAVVVILAALVVVAVCALGAQAAARTLNYAARIEAASEALP